MKRYYVTVSFLAILVGTGLWFASCGQSTDIEETGQQVGDVMASIDEQGGSVGTLTQLDGVRKTFRRLSPNDVEDTLFEKVFAPSAYAVSCSGYGFGSCSSNVVTRTFGGCTVGAATFSGTVTFTWGGASAACTLTAANDTITRVPSFTVTGRRGATLTVSKSGSVGQRITWSSGTGTSKVFSFSNDGIRRVFADSAGTTTFDYTTATTSAITVTGTSRSNRVLSGGSLRVTDNLTGGTCDFVPTAVTWNASTCNCPVSGSWAGTCSDGSSNSLTLTGCGTGTLVIGSSSQDITFDRCASS